jgi:CDP-2,3-bis-(O-geranylgeranyl)-sn-glycerol synthase
MIELKLLLLIIIANGAPVVAHDVLRDRFNQPIDGGRIFLDGRPWLGASKTWRGLLSAVLVTVPAALLLGFTWQLGALVAGGAMAGDLLSSFCKRRLNLGTSSMALGLDQIPESLLPLLAAQTVLDLGADQIVYLLIAFFVVELSLSALLFKLGLRARPY